MTTTISFSRQKAAFSRARTTWYWENLVLVHVLVLENTGLYLQEADPMNELSRARAVY